MRSKKEINKNNNHNKTYLYKYVYILMIKDCFDLYYIITLQSINYLI